MNWVRHVALVVAVAVTSSACAAHTDDAALARAETDKTAQLKFAVFCGPKFLACAALIGVASALGITLVHQGTQNDVTTYHFDATPEQAKKFRASGGEPSLLDVAFEALAAGALMQRGVDIPWDMNEAKNFAEIQNTRLGDPCNKVPQDSSAPSKIASCEVEGKRCWVWDSLRTGVIGFKPRLCTCENGSWVDCEYSEAETSWMSQFE